MKRFSKLYIIILSYNSGEKIISCLKSLSLAEIPANWQVRILVIDNGSTDNSVLAVRKYRDKSERRNRLTLELVENRRNLGFAAGCNLGIKEALKDWAHRVMFLNQDTVVEKDFLSHLLASSADIVAPVIKFRREGEWVLDLGGKVNMWIGRTTHIECSNVQMFKCSKLDYVSGCAMMIKAEVFEKIGLLDERFFLYFEDADFCLRAKKAGFKIAVEPKALIVHKLTAPPQRSKIRNLHLVKSNLSFINKHIDWPQRFLAYTYGILFSLKVLVLK